MEHRITLSRKVEFTVVESSRRSYYAVILHGTSGGMVYHHPIQENIHRRADAERLAKVGNKLIELMFKEFPNE